MVKDKPDDDALIAEAMEQAAAEKQQHVLKRPSDTHLSKLRFKGGTVCQGEGGEARCRGYQRSIGRQLAGGG